MRLTPTPMVGEASRHPPAADAMKRSSADPAFFTGSVWLMSAGSWKINVIANGAAGTATASVPVPAMPLRVLHMDRGIGVLLGGLVLLLAPAWRGLRLPQCANPG